MLAFWYLRIVVGAPPLLLRELPNESARHDGEALAGDDVPNERAMTTRQPTLIAQIEEEETILLEFWTRFVALKAFETELVTRTGANTFNIANTVVWDAMFAKRDALVIHFASWVRGICGPGGFFRQLRSHHVPELRTAFLATRTEVPKLQARDPRRIRVDPRFPAAVERGQLNPEDIDALKDAVWAELESVIKDRDSFRAHPFERGQKADAKILDLDEVEGLLAAAQRLLNDLRLLANNTSFGYSYQSLTDAGGAAADLVDLLLFGSSIYFATIIGANEIQTKEAYWWERRDAFLVALQSAHAARPDLPINDDTLIEVARSKAEAAISAQHARSKSVRARTRRLWFSLRRRIAKLRRK